MPDDIRTQLDREDAVRRGVADPPKPTASFKRNGDDPTHDDDVRLLAEFALSTGQTPDGTRKAAWRVLGEVADANQDDRLRAQGVVDGDKAVRDADAQRIKDAQDESAKVK